MNPRPMFVIIAEDWPAEARERLRQVWGESALNWPHPAILRASHNDGTPSVYYFPPDPDKPGDLPGLWLLKPGHTLYCSTWCKDQREVSREIIKHERKMAGYKA